MMNKIKIFKKKLHQKERRKVRQEMEKYKYYDFKELKAADNA